MINEFCYTNDKGDIMKVGIVDIGSNTVRLVIYRYQNGKVTKLINKKYMCSLVSYVKKGKLSKQGINVLIEALCSFKEILIDFKIDKYSFFATASLRNISNAKEVLNELYNKTSIKVRVLSKKEEGKFNYLGIKHNQKLSEGLIIDIGGGSSETVCFKEETIYFNESLSIGSLNLYSNHVAGIMPTSMEIDILEEIINSYLMMLPNDLYVKEAIGVGGTIRAMFEFYNSFFKEKEYLNKNDINKVLKSICSKQGMKQFLKVKPDRVHTIIPGLLILRGIMKRYKIERISLSTQGLKEGYLLELMEGYQNG